MRRFDVKVLGVGLGFLVAGAACSTDKPNPKNCPPQGPAFVVTITAGEKPLPEDTEVTVRFGGGEEEFRLADPACCPSVLFCTAVSADGGIVDAGSGVPVEALRCDLWTGGSATLEVRATSYVNLSEPLQAKPMPEGCGLGVVTQDVPIELEPLDGGS